MCESKVADIVTNQHDVTGAVIDTVYAKLDPIYAVYRSSERVMVHIADDKALASAQQTTLSMINPIRGEINGLIDGWRASDAPDKKAKADLFDRRIADALVVALQGYPVQAEELLHSARRDLIEERTAWARFQYLLAALATAAALIAVFTVLTSSWFTTTVHRFTPEALTLWSAASVGTVGAFFSIAIAIRSRTVLTDLQTCDNTADAALRIVIGAIAAALLVVLLDIGFVRVSIGDHMVSSSNPDSWLLTLVIAFMGGFSERLVPDLLEKSALGAQPSGARRPGSAVGLTPAGGLVPSTSYAPADGSIIGDGGGMAGQPA